MTIKKALMLASVASMIDQFNIPNIQLLQSLGYIVDVVADFSNNPGTITKERAELLQRKLRDMDVKVIDIPIPRTINPSTILKAYKQISALLERNHYNLIHCHSPIGGALCRVAANKERVHGTKVIYTAHGFHFYDGAPLKNWLLFYPIEKFLSKWTDVLITINKEDYKRAVENFYAKKTVYIPGVGVDTKKFADCNVDVNKKRQELGVKPDVFLLLSVGELNQNKNQKIIIDALGKMKEEGCLNNIVYLAVGKGVLRGKLELLIEKYGIEKQVKLLGFRSDISELCKTADCFVHPSLREGLGLAPLEAMASGLPLIISHIGGIRDYTKNGVSGCSINPKSVDEMVSAIVKMRDNILFREECGKNNRKSVKPYDIRNTNEIMRDVYSII